MGMKASMKARTVLALATWVAAIGLFSASCAKSETDQGGPAGSQGVGSADTTPDLVRASNNPPRKGGTLTMALEAETDGWDYTKNRWAASGTEVAWAIFDPLTAFDKDFNPKPYLA